MKRDLLAALSKARASAASACVITDLSSGHQELVLDPSAHPREDAVRGALRADAPALLEDGGARWFIHPFNPPLRLVVVGAVHITQSLARMAAEAGYAVTVVDPRSSFAEAARFPGVELSDAWPDEYMDEHPPDTRTAVVTLTHDPKLDDPALEAALKSSAFYVGALGSRRTHAARLHRLEERGFGEEERARVHGPVGLPIGARSPAEIAISILAQMTEVLRRGHS